MIDINKLLKKESDEINDSRNQHSRTTDDQEPGKIDEITIVIRGGKIVKFEQRLV